MGHLEAEFARISNHTKAGRKLSLEPRLVLKLLDQPRKPYNHPVRQRCVPGTHLCTFYSAAVKFKPDGESEFSARVYPTEGASFDDKVKQEAWAETKRKRQEEKE